MPSLKEHAMKMMEKAKKTKNLTLMRNEVMTRTLRVKKRKRRLVIKTLKIAGATKTSSRMRMTILI